MLAEKRPLLAGRENQGIVKLSLAKLFALIETLRGGGGGAAPMSLVCILKCLVSVFKNASRRCRKLNENSLSLSEF